jgi:UDP-3-O-[3-hydroxymyristoyl] N-acetylglucosamine deacetylase
MKKLLQEVVFDGVGLHSGKLVRMIVKPKNTPGICFVRTDIIDDNTIEVLPANIKVTALATRLQSATNPDCFVNTIEHILAGLWGCGIRQATITVDAPEIPIMDGSSSVFIESLQPWLDSSIAEQTVAIECSMYFAYKQQFVSQKEMVDYMEVNNLKKVWIAIHPLKNDEQPTITYTIDYPHVPLIGCQTYITVWDPQVFCRDIAMARTFCLRSEIDWMQANKLALGGSLDNAIVIDNDANMLVNPTGWRTDKELVKHKILDCIGDLSTVPARVLGHIEAYCCGHELHGMVAQAIYSFYSC